MELEVSQKAKKASKKAKLTVEQLAFADLIAVGWEPGDAFILAHRKGQTWMKSAFAAEVEKQKNNPAVVERVNEVKGVLSSQKKEAAKGVKKNERSAIIDAAMSKEQMLYDLQTAIAGMQPGSKEWLDTKKLIVDVTRMKQEEIQKDDSTVHYYLPVRYPTSCQNCLYSRCDECRYKKESEELGE